MLITATVPPHTATLPDALRSSFVAKDSTGCIIFGTTADAFFSLDRLATFLREAPLDLKIALNLDGGPMACQGIALNGYRRDFCGDWEMRTERGQLRLLRRLIGNQRWDCRLSSRRCRQRHHAD